MSDIDFPAQGCAYVALGAGRLRSMLLTGVAGAVVLANASVAAAQDITNTAPFSNSGTYAGRVLSNTSTIFNNGPAGAWTGDIVSNAGFVTNTGAGAVWTGSVSNDNSVTNQNGALWVGDVIWNNNSIRNNAGSTWQGDVLSNGGSNSLTQIENRGTWVGAVRGNTTRIFNEAAWTGDVVGNTGNIYNNYAGTNAAVWNGNVVSNSYLILNFAGGTWNGNVTNNPGDIANYGAWNGNLTNSGKIIHTGVWTGDIINNGTYFRAENQIIGAFDNRGALQLTGNLSGITTLTNSGRLQLTQNSGSQTLSVGSLVLASTSSYEINVTAAGATDKIVVSGSAALAGTVKVVAATGTPYASPISYTILSAGSISGQFAGVTTDLAFFAAQLSYDVNNVYLTMKRNNVGFGETGATGNQVGVGASVEMLRAGNSLYDAVLWLTPEQARRAFDMLSGEAHASAENMAMDQAGLVGGVVLNRLRQTFREPKQTAYAMGYASDPVIASDPATGGAFWTALYGAVGTVAAGTGTSSLRGSSGGVAIGLDGVYDDWRAGIMMHAGSTSSTVNALGSTIGSADYGLGVYGGREWGDTRLALGAIYTWHDIHSTRSVAFAGFTDVLAGQYAAGTAQAFAELSHAFDLRVLSLRPYAGLAYISRTTEKFAETGGAAALSRTENTVSATFTTLGLGAERQFAVGDDVLLTASGSLGWRHSYADTPAATYAFAGGPGFSVVGAAVASDMVALNAGLTHDVSATTMIDLSYDGLLGESAQTHSLKGTWAMRF